MERYETYDGEPITHFHVEITTTHYQRDNNNYIAAFKTDTETLGEDSLAELYERMARFKASDTVETHGPFSERSEVTFGTIYESVAQGEVDMNLLEQTEAWAAHIQKVNAAAAAKVVKLAAEEEARAAKVLKDEKTLLASLLAKHGRS